MEFKDCFISYSHKDEDEVLKIVQNLQKIGYSILMDSSFSAGENWKEKAEEYVLSTKCTIVFISDNSLISVPVLEELRCAKNEEERANYHYFAVILDNESIKDKYLRLKSESTNVRDVLTAGKIYDLLPQDNIYILNDSSLIERIADSLKKYSILPHEVNKQLEVSVKPSSSNSYSFINFSSEISIFSINGDDKEVALMENNYIDLGGNVLYRMVLLPTNSKNAQVNIVYAKEIKLIDVKGTEILHEYINRIDCNYSENILDRGYNCINIDFLTNEDFLNSLSKTKRICLTLEIESIHNIITTSEFVIYIAGIKDNKNNPDVKEYKDMITLKLHHTKVITKSIIEK